MRILPVAGHVVNQRIKPLAVFDHQGIESRAIPLLRALHEHAVLLFVGQSGIGHTKGAVGCGADAGPGES